jgi:hypothetical protein
LTFPSKTRHAGNSGFNALLAGKIMSKSTLKILPVLTVAITTVWLSQPVFADPMPMEPTLTLTEVSNTQLDWAWDAAGGGFSGSIAAVSPDHWANAPISGPNLNFPPSLGIIAVRFWTEPEGGFHNDVAVAYFQSNSTTFTWEIGSVDSDVIGDGTMPDGTTGNVGGFYNLAFFDKGDVASVPSVPDTGTTASLLGLSLAGLAFLRRKLC